MFFCELSACEGHATLYEKQEHCCRKGFLLGLGVEALQPWMLGLTMRTAMQGRNATHIVDKMLRNAYNMAYIRMTLPGACLIHAVRHPLDVALSCFAQPFEGRGLPWASQLDGALIPSHQDTMTTI